jgi:hypothetical protein
MSIGVLNCLDKVTDDILFQSAAKSLNFSKTVEISIDSSQVKIKQKSGIGRDGIKSYDYEVSVDGTVYPVGRVDRLMVQNGKTVYLGNGNLNFIFGLRIIDSDEARSKKEIFESQYKRSVVPVCQRTHVFFGCLDLENASNPPDLTWVQIYFL